MDAILDGFSGAILGYLTIAIVWELVLRDRLQRRKLGREIQRELNAIFREARER